jgi:hypothetical protein
LKKFFVYKHGWIWSYHREESFGIEIGRRRWRRRKWNFEGRDYDSKLGRFGV